jgi:hypothetical protein
MIISRGVKLKEENIAREEMKIFTQLMSVGKRNEGKFAHNFRFEFLS